MQGCEKNAASHYLYAFSSGEREDRANIENLQRFSPHSARDEKLFRRRTNAMRAQTRFLPTLRFSPFGGAPAERLSGNLKSAFSSYVVSCSHITALSPTLIVLHFFGREIFGLSSPRRNNGYKCLLALFTEKGGAECLVPSPPLQMF